MSAPYDQMWRYGIGTMYVYSPSTSFGGSLEYINAGQGSLSQQSPGRGTVVGSYSPNLAYVAGLNGAGPSKEEGGIHGGRGPSPQAKHGAPGATNDNNHTLFLQPLALLHQHPARHLCRRECLIRADVLRSRP